MHYLLIYELAPDYLQRRRLWRDAHLALAWQAVERGEMVLAGPLSEPSDRSILLFQGDSASAAEAFASADPYVTNGVVLSWQVRHWLTSVGHQASSPLLPAASR